MNDEMKALKTSGQQMKAVKGSYEGQMAYVGPSDNEGKVKALFVDKDICGEAANGVYEYPADTFA